MNMGLHDKAALCAQFCMLMHVICTLTCVPFTATKALVKVTLSRGAFDSLKEANQRLSRKEAQKIIDKNDLDQVLQGMCTNHAPFVLACVVTCHSQISPCRQLQKRLSILRRRYHPQVRGSANRPVCVSIIEPGVIRCRGTSRLVQEPLPRRRCRWTA